MSWTASLGRSSPPSAPSPGSIDGREHRPPGPGMCCARRMKRKPVEHRVGYDGSARATDAQTTFGGFHRNLGAHVIVPNRSLSQVYHQPTRQTPLSQRCLHQSDHLRFEHAAAINYLLCLRAETRSMPRCIMTTSGLWNPAAPAVLNAVPPLIRWSPMIFGLGQDNGRGGCVRVYVSSESKPARTSSRRA